MIDDDLEPNTGSLSSQEKKRLALAGVATAALIGLAIWIARKPDKDDDKDYGIKVDDLCVNATITDAEKLRRSVEDTYDTQIAKGNTDPLSITQAFFLRIAPQCQIYPKTARSPKEAEFFLILFFGFLEQLEVDGMITEDEGRARMFEAMAWASRAGWKPTGSVEPLFSGAAQS